MSQLETLTPAESEELSSLLNMIAHNVLRYESPGVRQPAWLCLSPEAKADARARAVQWMVKYGLLIVLSETAAEQHLRSSPGMDAHLSQWQTVETDLKRLRAEGEPGAFFYPA